MSMETKYRIKKEDNNFVIMKQGHMYAKGFKNTTDALDAVWRIENKPDGYFRIEALETNKKTNWSVMYEKNGG